ncbi:MAG: 4Fe-4S binding protein [Desulfofustis sp.]|nr:4Fe-4S binding protein [Desulfofustis sp.]
MISLSSLAERFSSTPSDGVAQLHTERCLRTRLSTHDCRRCLAVCPDSALRLEDRRIELDAECCSGCGRCRAVCPSDAVTSAADITQIIANLRGQDRAVISCSRQPRQTEDELVLPCLGLLSPPALLAIGGGGCATVVFHTGGCATCVNAPAADAFLADLHSVAALIERCCGSRLEPATETIPEAPRPAASRRSYLLDLKRSVRSLPAAGPRSSGSNRPGASPSGRQIPEKIRFINQLLTRVNEGMKQELRSAWLPRLSITSACTNCPRCAGICPTGALKRRSNEAGKHLVFNASRCSGCRLCVEFCPESAITVTESSPPSAPSPLG